MSLKVEFSDDELPKLKQLLDRALNCWDPAHVPQWAWQLDAKVVAKINDLKVAEELRKSDKIGMADYWDPMS